MADTYRALTRTYRPHTFEDIVSQEHVSETLKNAIKQNRLSHAYMFCGPRGVGKTTMARVLARKINGIDEDVDVESLNQTLNVIEIDAASNNGVDDIRELRERVRIPPQNGPYKIYIIDEVHMLSKSAFNALLKTLEEPPGHVIFIFATTEPHKVLPTILSRVQRFDFKRISIDLITTKLKKIADKEKIKIDDESLHVIAKKADGALRDALGLLDQAIAFCGTTIGHNELLQALNVVSTDRLFEFMETVEQHNAAAGLSLINTLLEEGYDIQEFLVELTEHLRNLYVAHHSQKMHLVEATENTKKRYKKTAEAFSEDDLMRMLHIVNEAQFKMKDAHQPKVQFEITLLKLIHMERGRQLNTLLKELEQLKKKKLNNLAPKTEHSADNKNGSFKNEGVSNGEEAKSKSSASPRARFDADEQHREFVPSATNAVKEATEEDANGNTSPSEFEGIFGKPSLQNGTATLTQVKNSIQTKKPTAANRIKNITLDKIKENWELYVNQLRKHVPQMLYFQMQRVEPYKLKNRELFLRCSDSFAQKMVDENKQELAKLLEGIIGGFLRFSCKVREDTQDEESTLSPYERFKQLQQRDPAIKKLVELFGAELDYNLNQ